MCTRARCAVADGDAGSLLAAVLEREQPEEGHLRDTVAVWRRDAEHAALFLGRVVGETSLVVASDGTYRRVRDGHAHVSRCPSRSAALIRVQGRRPDRSCAREPLVGDDVAASGGRPHLVGQLGHRAVALVADVGEGTADDLFVEAFGFVAGGEALLVVSARSTTATSRGCVLRRSAAVRRRRSTPNSYLVSARISPARSPRSTPRPKSASAAASTRSHSSAWTWPARRRRQPRERHVVAAVGSLGGRGDDGIGERGVLAESVGESYP